MTAWLLTLALYTGTGTSVTAVIVPDKTSCIRSGEHFMRAGLRKYSKGNTYYTCTEITKGIQ